MSKRIDLDIIEAWAGIIPDSFRRRRADAPWTDMQLPGRAVMTIVRRGQAISCTNQPCDPPPVICSCPPSHLCDGCLEHLYSCLAGTAEARGIRWCESVPRRPGPWPRTPKARTIAERKVADLGSDPRLLARLADSCEMAAEREWDALDHGLGPAPSES